MEKNRKINKISFKDNIDNKKLIIYKYFFIDNFKSDLINNLISNLI